MSRGKGVRSSYTVKDRTSYKKRWYTRVKARLSKLGCMLCGTTDPVRLMFIHPEHCPDPLFPVSKGWTQGWVTLQDYRDEVKKCLRHDSMGNILPSLLCPTCRKGFLLGARNQEAEGVAVWGYKAETEEV